MAEVWYGVEQPDGSVRIVGGGSGELIAASARVKELRRRIERAAEFWLGGAP